MKRHAARVFIAAAALAMAGVLLGCPPVAVAPARLVVDQGGYGESGGYSVLGYSSFFGGIQELGDNFTLPGPDTTLVSLRWWGAYRDNVTADDDFDILLYLDDGAGMPNSWSSYAWRAPSATRTATASLLEPGAWDLTVYQYEAELPHWVLESGRRYFIVVLNEADTWMWATNGAPAEGDGWGISRATTAGAWGTHGSDMAFMLWATR